MADNTQAGISMIRHVAARLGNLCEKVVFLGGAVTGLLLTDTAASEARFTEDVDVIVAIGSRADYYRLEEALREKGFTNVRDVICRWNIDGVLVDVMPTNAAILGFSNRWYSGAIKTATSMTLGDNLVIRLITSPYFVATKLEAFRNPHRQGGGDYLLSRDLSDIIAIIDGRQELLSEIIAAPADLRHFLAGEMKRLVSDWNFLDALPAHLLPDEATQLRLPLLIRRIEEIAALT